jgi:hypothetical protein
MTRKRIANPIRRRTGMFPAVRGGVHIDMSEVDGDVFDIRTGDEFQ